MAYDIGPVITIEGEDTFRKKLKNVSENIKTLGSEMKVVTATFADNEDSIEALSAKNEVLSRTAAAVEEKIALQRKAVSSAAKNFGEAATKTLQWERALNESVAQLEDIKRQISKNESAMDGFADAADDLADAMEDAGDEAKDAQKSFGALDVALGNLASKGIEAVVSGIGDAVSALVGLGDSTREFRQEQAKVNTAFQTAGHSVETAEKAYKGLYEILGDSGEAAEASQLLANLAENTEDVSKWTEIAAGVAGTFGDALPISGLVEAANETAKVGQVTGALADALNWVGINEDDFNAKLSELATTEQRTAYITDVLSGAYSDAANAFRENNAGIMQANANQLMLDSSLAKVGASVDLVKNSFLEAFGPTITELAAQFAEYIANIDVSELTEGIERLISSFDVLVPVITGAVAAMVAYKGAVAISALIDNLTKASEGMTIAQAALNAVMNANPFVLVATLIAGLVTALITLWNTNEDFRNAVKKLWDTIKSAILTVVEKIKGAFTSLVDWFKNLPEKFKEIGKNIVQGVWNGIQNMAQWIKDKVSGFFSGIVDSVKGLLGIHSPSRVFAGIGENMAAGLGVGFDGEFGSIQKQINHAMSDLAPEMSGSVTIGTNAMGSGSGMFNSANFAYVVGAEVRRALDGVVVQMDGNKVGKLVTVHQRNDGRAFGAI